MVKSFFSTLNLELYLDAEVPALQMPQHLKWQLSFWIEGCYNRKRRHSTTFFLSPTDHEQQHIVACTLATVRPSSLPKESLQPRLCIKA
jgi:putative transposase